MVQWPELYTPKTRAWCSILVRELDPSPSKSCMLQLRPGGELEYDRIKKINITKRKSEECSQERALGRVFVTTLHGMKKTDTFLGLSVGNWLMRQDYLDSMGYYTALGKETGILD